MTPEIQKLIEDGRWQPIEDFTEAPLYIKRVRNLKGKEIVIEEWQKQWCIVRAKDGVEQLSYYIHEEGRWCYFTKELPPLYFIPLPDNRLADALEVAVKGITETLEDLCHLADGDNCTLIKLKQTLAEIQKIAANDTP